MQQLDGRLIYSATDLNNFLACEHLTALDLDSLLHGLPRPDAKPEQAHVLSRLGEEHEQNYLQQLLAAGKPVVTIARGDLTAAAGATLAAMRDGAAIIYQATFYDGDWVGHADFLRRIPGASGLGSWHYEVLDTKLARHTEPYFLLQLCYYSDHVERLQGRAAEHMYVVLGDGEEHRFRVGDFSAYYRGVKSRFARHNAAARTSQAALTYPLPVSHCKLCAWNERCEQQRKTDDHLSLVANMTRLQTARLNEAGIQTLAQLGNLPHPPRPEKIKRTTFEKLTRQARLQLEQRLAIAAGDPSPYRYELLPFDTEEPKRRGFALLPPPSPGDIFFDMEGDPYYEITAGLEYLFGAYGPSDATFYEFWGCDRSLRPVNDRAAERLAFESFIDFIVQRLVTDPNLHIYHYAPYEKTALQKLSQRHGTREDEVDEILRKNLLVDLYTVVRQSIAVGQPGYSIKKLEAYYQARQIVSIKAGDESILAFETWLTTRHRPSERNDGILDELRAYNEQDCVSTYLLREWLLKLRADAIAHFGVEIPPFALTVEENRSVDRANDKHAELKARLGSFPEGTPQWSALQMLEYHWREDKPVWWQFHDRCAAYLEDPTDLLDDSETLCGLEPAGDWTADKQSRIYPMRFPIQQHKIESGECFNPRDKKPAGTIVKVEEFEDYGIVSIRRGPSLFATPLPDAITVRSVVRAGTVRDAIARFASELCAQDPPGSYRAAYDVLTNATPRLRGRAGSTVLQPAALDERGIQRIVDELDESYLFVQGPPGSGKTYYGARLIVTLLQRNLRVGVTANSHKAIHNLLREIEEVAQQRGVRFSGVKTSPKDAREKQYVSEYGFIIDTDKGLPPEGPGLVAGTAWAFSPAAMDGTLDYLFIDEAGQVALPQALASMTAARNVVLLGDPLQLAQVSHTSHPGDIGASVLEHLLDDELHPVAPERGIFLADTYRMHGDVCRFISEVIYDGRLHPAAKRDNQRVESPGLSGTGLRFIPVHHENNRQSSAEECERIADEIEKLLQGSITDIEGMTRPLQASDIIVVTPYNAQARCIRAELQSRPACRDVQVGTVDKFQGQEAYVVFFSTAASSAEDAPRGIDFVFDRNRLNVAVSRARALAVLVSSPKLLTAACFSIEQVRTLNGALRFIELAGPIAPAGQLALF